MLTDGPLLGTGMLDIGMARSVALATRGSAGFSGTLGAGESSANGGFVSILSGGLEGPAGISCFAPSLCLAGVTIAPVSSALVIGCGATGSMLTTGLRTRVSASGTRLALGLAPVSAGVALAIARSVGR